MLKNISQLKKYVLVFEENTAASALIHYTNTAEAA